jgi:hypothetical protein
MVGLLLVESRTKVPEWVGTYFYINFDFSWRDNWEFFLQYYGIFCLLWVLGLYRQNSISYKLYKDITRKSGGTVTPPSAPGWYPKVENFLKKYSWRVNLILFFACSMVVPSVLGYGYLLIIFFFVVIQKEKIPRILYPIIGIYLGAFTIAQYIYNLPFRAQYSSPAPIWQDIGFFIFEDVYGVDNALFFFKMGLQIITCSFTSIVYRLTDSGSNFGQNNAKASSDTNTPQHEEELADSIVWKQPEPSTLSKVFVRIQEVLDFALTWVLHYSNFFALFAIYLCSLARINIFSAFYLVFLVIFSTWPTLARKFWILLVLYNDVVISVIYLYQIPATIGFDERHPTLAKNFGFSRFNVTFGIGDGFFWYGLILLFSSLEYWVLEASSIQDDWHKSKTKLKRLPFFAAVGKFLNRYGWILSYFTIIIVALVDKVNLFTVGYVVLFSIFVLVKCAVTNPDRIISILWPSIVLFSGMSFVSKYVFQFESVATWLTERYPQHLRLTLQDLGVVVYNGELQLFVGLLGDTFVFLITIIQLRLFYTTKAKRKREKYKLETQRKSWNFLWQPSEKTKLLGHSKKMPKYGGIRNNDTTEGEVHLLAEDRVEEEILPEKENFCEVEQTTEPNILATDVTPQPKEPKTYSPLTAFLIRAVRLHSPKLTVISLGLVAILRTSVVHFGTLVFFALGLMVVDGVGSILVLVLAYNLVSLNLIQAFRLSWPHSVSEPEFFSWLGFEYQAGTIQILILIYNCYNLYIVCLRYVYRGMGRYSSNIGGNCSVVHPEGINIPLGPPS